MKTLNATKFIAAFSLGAALAVPALMPATADAQTWRKDSHRQQSKNNWRNLGIAGGALGIAGLFTGNKALTVLGLGGGAYSAYRYEQDRKSQNRLEHSRYQLFSNRSFDYKGHHYVRHTRGHGRSSSYYFQRVH